MKFTVVYVYAICINLQIHLPIYMTILPQKYGWSFDVMIVQGFVFELKLMTWNVSNDKKSCKYPPVES